MNSKFVIAALLGWSLNCAAEVKIGLVDLQRAVLQTSDGQRAKNALEAEFKNRQGILQKMEANMRKMNEEFERKADVLAKGAQEKQQSKMQGEWRKFQEAVAKNQRDMEKRQRELCQPIVQKLNAIIAEISKKEGFTLVVNRPDQLILFAIKEIDLTDQIVGEYNRGRT